MIIIEFIEQNWIEIIGAIIGLLYLYFEYKAELKMWPSGIAMSTFYTYVFIKAEFYAFACINVYYIIAGLYGWIKWLRSPKDKKDLAPVQLRHSPTRLYLPLIVASIIIYIVIVWLLTEFTDSHVIYGDSFVTTLSILAMWMLAQRFVEQWILLIIVNIVSVFLYLFQDLYPTSIMYLIYSIVSVFGYIRWKNLVNEEN